MTDTPQEDDRWTGPETATFAYHPITLLNDHPLPLGEDEAASLWNHNEQLQQEYNEPPHPDELHEAYTSKITETEMWEAFRIPLVGFTNRLYFWNSHGGHGFAINTQESESEAIAEIIMAVAMKRNRNQVENVIGEYGFPEPDGHQ
jgi:hypothetical protein